MVGVFSTAARWQVAKTARIRNSMIKADMINGQGGNLSDLSLNMG